MTNRQKLLKKAHQLALGVLAVYRARGVPELAAVKAGIRDLEARGVGSDRFGKLVLERLKERLVELEQEADET